MGAAIAAAVITAAATAGTAYYSSVQQKKAAEKQRKAAMGVNAGGKPEIARYQPVDFNDEQLRAITDNYGALPAISDLMSATNGLIDADAMKRAKKFIPNYESMMQLQGDAANDLLGGHLPYDDVLEIVGNRGELANRIGTPGAAAPATLRDLGMSRLGAIESGAGLMKGMVNIAETVNPVGRRMRPQDMFIDPTQRIKMAMEQNQLIQQSDQSAYNIEAGISPTEMARQQAAIANPPPQIDWGKIISSAAGSAAGAYGTYQQSATGATGAAASASPNSSGFYSNPTSAYNAYYSAGYSPVIQKNPSGKGYYSAYSVPA